jgi:hypothetical protein
MQIPLQIGLEVPDTNNSKFRFLNWQCLPLVVTVLRTGCILTTGHPLQVNGGKHIEFRHFTGPSFTAVNALISA